MKRSLTVTLVAVAACSALIQWSSCGSSGSSSTPTSNAPVISAITITGGNAVHSDITLDADPIVTNVSTATSSMAVTFTSTDTVTVPENSVTLTCASGTAPTLGTPTASGNTFTFAITGTFPQLTICTLTFTDAITNGTPMVAVSKNFMTGCSTNDDFSIDTVTGTPACWTEKNASNGTFSVASGAVDLTTSTPITSYNPNGIFGVSKTFANSIFSSTSDITVMVTVTNTAGPSSSLNEANPCSLIIYDSNTTSVLTNAAEINISRNQAGAYEVRYNSTGDVIDSSSKILCIMLNNNVATYGTSADGTTCTPLPDVGEFGNTSQFSSPTGDAVIGLYAISILADELSCQFDNFTITGASATGQD